MRDEVDAWLVGHHESWLQTTSASQTVQSELRRWLHLIVEAHVVLSESLHVVYVHSHHVTESVWHEQGMTSTYSLFRVTLHQSDGFQMFGEDAASTQVHVEPLDVGFGILNHPVVGSLHSRVDVALLLRELARDGRDACIV